MRTNKTDSAITAAIKRTIDTFGVHPWDINNGECEEFAEEIEKLIPGAVAMWGDEIGDVFTREFDPEYHKFIEFEGRYYDAEEPYGVDDPRLLAFYLRQFAMTHIKGVAHVG